MQDGVKQVVTTKQQGSWLVVDVEDTQRLPEITKPASETVSNPPINQKSVEPEKTPQKVV
jgi:hypothetical protein